MVKSPLRKRFLRELKGDLGKYLVIFLIMVLSIGEISGYLVADGSMIRAYDESFEKYTVEDGNFISEKPLSDRQKEAARECGIEVYDLFSSDRPLENGSTLRFFQVREEVDRACLMEGELPEADDEIAVDRMYADNNGIQTGDALTGKDGVSYKVTGLVALSDYSTMFEKNTDTMFDATRFGVGVVTKEAFAKFDRDELIWRYAWLYDEPPASEEEAQERAEELVKDISAITSLKEFIPRHQNQAIMFTGNDMGSDRSMMMIFLYAIIIILAFVFAVTISSTISKEAAEIGTLRAMGFSRGELLRHYMTLPVIVTLTAALVGNILGYTWFKYFNAGLYYNSYSLPTYVTVWNAEAFLMTTIIPIVLMVLINSAILYKKLRLSPLKFLRKDLRKSSDRRAVPLSKRIPFFTRFRLRIVFQNMGSYGVLLLGVLFANFLLLFGLMFPAVLDNYMKALPDNMFTKYQYVLTLPAGAVNEDRKVESLVNMAVFRNAVETQNEDAEKFSAYALRTIPGSGIMDEELMIYGVSEDSRYLDMDLEGDDVLVSSAYAEKWDISPGDEIELKETYGDERYRFRVTGIWPYDVALAVFMDREALNETFGLGEGTFSGYFSDTEITDIDEKYIGQVIDFDSLSKLSRQLQISMGGMMKLVDAFAIIIFMILVYLLSKVIIEKNAGSISMVRILGYSSGEVARLYIMATSILTIAFLILSIPAEVSVLTVIFRQMVRQEMTGWIPFMLSSEVYVKMILYGILTYAVVALLEYRKLRKIPMGEALKNAE